MNVDRPAITALVLFGLLGIGFAVIGLGMGHNSTAPVKKEPELAGPETLPTPRVMEAPSQAIYVTVSAPGLSVEEIETSVASRLEGALVGLDGIASVRTHIENGQCRSILAISSGRDENQVRTDAMNAINGVLALLPEGILPPVIERRAPDALPSLWIAAMDDRRTESELSAFLSSVVVKEMLTIPGVSGIGLHGDRRRELQLFIDPQKMAAFGLTPSEVVEALSKSAVDGLNPESIKKLEELVIVKRNETPILVRDVAKIEETARRETFAFLDGRRQVLAGIHIADEANAPEVSAAIRARLPKLAVPEGMKVEVVADATPASAAWVFVECQFPSGIQIVEVEQQALRIEQTLRELPPAEIGSILTLGPKPNQAEPVVRMLVSLAAGHAHSADEIQARIRTVAKRLPSVRIRTMPLDAGSRFQYPESRVRLRLAGGDLNALHLWSAEIDRLASEETSGLADVFIVGLASIPEQRLTVDRERASALGLSAKDVVNAYETAVGSRQIRVGDIAINLRIGRESIAVLNVRPEEIGLIPVFVKDKKSIPLKDVAKLQQVQGPAVVERWNGKRCVVINANPLSGTSLETATASLRKIAEESRNKLKLPPTCQILDE